MAEESESGRTSALIYAADFGVGAPALERLRAAAEDVCDASAAGTLEDFRYSTSVRAVHSALLIEGRNSAVRYDRTARHVARGGIDNYQVTMHLDGGSEFFTGRRTVRTRPGDVLLVDMAEANGSHVWPGESGVAHLISLLLPRPLLAPLLAAPDASSGRLVARETAEARRIGEQLLALHRGDPQLAPGAAVAGVAGLVAGAVGQARAAEPAVSDAARAMLLAAIKRHIEANLLSEAVGVAALCRRFRLSRASLYRLFEPEGGLVHFVQERRLQHALRRLVSAAGGDMRVIDLAVDYHFSSDNTFVRTFRRRFGVTPGEVRALAATRRKSPPAPG
jgi:AraC-like DNA-binding protein